MGPVEVPLSERRQEEEYFERIDREKKEKLKAKLDEQNQSDRVEMEKELHWHKCGKCGADMETKLFRGIEIEVCPRCGAVLMDAGELEKLAGEDRSGFINGIRAMFSGPSGS